MTNKEVWDTVLTDAIVETDGRIQPYDKMLKFFYQKYHLKVIRLKKRGTKKKGQ